MIQTSTRRIFSVAILAIVIAGLLGAAMAMHRRHIRIAAEEGIRQELRQNHDGVEEMRAAIPREIKNISDAVSLLEQRESGKAVDASNVKIGLAVLALTNASWQTASMTGAIGTLDYAMIERFAGAYFEQTRLAQLQTATLESMMSLSSYVGRGERIRSLSPMEARAAEIQAQALIAHLRMMLRMTDGLQGAYKSALDS